MASRMTRMIFTILLMLAATTARGEPRLELPEEVFFYQPVASAWGQAGFWNNPASLGAGQSGNILVFTHRADRFIRDWGGAATWKFVGLAYRKINNDDISDVSEYMIGLGGGDKLRFGVSYRYFRDGPGYLNNRHLWTIGLQSHYNRNFRFGVRAENLNRGRIDGQRSDIRYVYGVGARIYKEIVSLTFDVNQLHTQSLDESEFRTGFDVRPIPGLYVFGDISNKNGFNIGIRANIEREYVTHYHSFDKDGKSRLGTTAFGMVNGNQPSLVTMNTQTLMMSLSGNLPESPDIPFFGTEPLTYYDYVGGIYDAAADDAITRLFLRIGSLRCGLAKTEELGQALAHFKSRGKTIIAYIDHPNNLGYLLASFADSIVIPPVSQLTLVGLRAELRTYTGLMEKIGVEAEIERIGDYKTSPERYFLDQPSDEARQEINRLLDSMYAYLVETIAVNRSLSPDSVRALIDQGPLPSITAVSSGLVNDRRYFDELDRSIGGTTSFYSYVQDPDYHDRWGDLPQLAILTLEGGIAGESGTPLVGEYDVIPHIRAVKDSDRIEGAVLRINSPGGLALPADLIWYELERLAKKKPLVISLGNVAASGGYYITTLDSPIYTDRNTITGSIGVYAGKVNTVEMFEKLGIYSETYGRGENSRFFSMIEPYTPKQREQLKYHLRLMYDHFVEKVADNRSLPADSVDNLGRGRVWTGAEAAANGLADTVGGLHEALLHLVNICELTGREFDLIQAPRQYYFWKNPFDFSHWIDNVAALIIDVRDAQSVLDGDLSGNIYYRLPYNLTIE